MSSTGVDRASPPAYSSDHEKGDVKDIDRVSLRVSLSSASKNDATHRQLKGRHIQLIGIGGTIGTSLYVCDALPRF